MDLPPESIEGFDLPTQPQKIGPLGWVQMRSCDAYSGPAALCYSHALLSCATSKLYKRQHLRDERRHLDLGMLCWTVRCRAFSQRNIHGMPRAVPRQCDLD